MGLIPRQVKGFISGFSGFEKGIMTGTLIAGLCVMGMIEFAGWKAWSPHRFTPWDSQERLEFALNTISTRDFNEAMEELMPNKALIGTSQLESAVTNPYLQQSKVEPKKERELLEAVTFNGPSEESSLEGLMDNVVTVLTYNSRGQVTPDAFLKVKDKRVSRASRAQGVMITPEGHMLTVAHAIRGVRDDFVGWSNRQVLTEGGFLYDITDILAIDHGADLALVKTNYRPKDFAPTRFLTTEHLKRGGVYTITGRVHKVNTGVSISSTDTSLEDRSKATSERYYSKGTFAGEKLGLWLDRSGQLFGVDNLRFVMHSEGGFSGSVISDKSGHVASLVSASAGKNTYGPKMERAEGLIDAYLDALDEAK